MKVIVHRTWTNEENDILGSKKAQIHTDMTRTYINRLNISEIAKKQLIKALYDEIHKNDSCNGIRSLK